MSVLTGQSGPVVPAPTRGKEPSQDPGANPVYCFPKIKLQGFEVDRPGTTVLGEFAREQNPYLAGDLFPDDLRRFFLIHPC